MKYYLLLFFTLIVLLKSQNITVAIKYLEDHAESSPGEESGKYIGNALKEAGFTIRESNLQPYDFYNGTLLNKIGFAIIGNNNYNRQELISGDIMVILNNKYPEDHICMYNGSKWFPDFVEDSIDNYYYDNYDIIWGNYFFRLEKNCLCYANYLEDDSLEDEYCQNIFWEFIQKKSCPHIPGIDGTKEEVDRCEMIYFCNKTTSSTINFGESQYLKLLKFIVFCFFFLFF
jgi:hypothetical protein